jgi:hypothetical protein
MLLREGRPFPEKCSERMVCFRCRWSFQLFDVDLIEKREEDVQTLNFARLLALAVIAAVPLTMSIEFYK